MHSKLNKLSIEKPVIRYITVQYNTIPSTITTLPPADLEFSYKVRTNILSLNSKSINQ